MFIVRLLVSPVVKAVKNPEQSSTTNKILTTNTVILVLARRSSTTIARTFTVWLYLRHNN